MTKKVFCLQTLGHIEAKKGTNQSQLTHLPRFCVVYTISLMCGNKQFAQYYIDLVERLDE